MIAVNNYEDFGYQNNGLGNDFGFGNNLFGGGGGFNGLTANIFDGGGGGSGTNFGIDVPIITSPSNRTFQITSNIQGAQIYINGINSFKTTSENITFTKSELLSGDKVITLVKEGYTNNEKYVISVENPTGATIINRPFLNIFNLPNLSEPFGISSTVIRVKYYINEVEQSSNDSETVTSVIQNLNFNLTEGLIEAETALYNFTVNVSGAGNSVRVVKNGSVEFFPDNGSTPYSDISGTTFKVESANTSLYRITQIQSNTRPPISAAPNESLSYNITLNNNASITITTELVKAPRPALNPQITLLKKESIIYNINSKLGVPIGFLKNADVKAVTVIIGQDILEFDDLQNGDVAGITIPHSVFKNIGKYGAKIFPFSLSDYENEVRPVEAPIKITTNPYSGGGGPSREVLTEVVVSTPPKVVSNPYAGGGTPSIGTPKPVTVTPRPSSGGGSYGGGSPYGGGGGPSRNREQNFR
jgi:hypothetical protein